MKNNINKAIIVLFSVTITFILSYYLTSMITQNQTNKLSKTVINKNVNSTNASSKISITKDTTVVFEVKFKKSNEISILNTIKAYPNFEGKTKKDIENKYNKSGYTLETVSKEKIIFKKICDTYSPNKYIIDIYEQGKCLAIFKTDADGKECIENKLSDIKYDITLDKLKSGDIDMLRDGDSVYQFKTKDEAEGSLNENFRS